MQPGNDQFLRIAALAADTLGVGISRIERAERIKGGLTNESWLVTGAGERVVVRVSTADEAALQIDRTTEGRILAQVQSAGVGPEVLRWHPEGRLLVTRYIPGTVWSREDAQAPDNIRRLAGLLRQLHSLEPRDDIAEVDLPAILDHYWATLAERQQPDPPSEWSRAEMRAAAVALTALGPLCLCHNDAHHLNVIDTGRLWLIDWEYAGVGSPWFDLASVACNHDYDEVQRRQLLRHYLGMDGGDALPRLDLACRLFDDIRTLWQVVEAGVTPGVRPGRSARLARLDGFIEVLRMGVLRVIDRDGVEHEVQGTYGQKIMEILRELDYGVTAICGGLCACATCHVHVDPEWRAKLPPRQSDETDLVSGTEEYEAEASRLSCQLDFTPALDGIRLRIVSQE